MNDKIRIYYGGLSKETNAFSPIPCEQDDFLWMESDRIGDPNGPFAPPP